MLCSITKITIFIKSVAFYEEIMINSFSLFRAMTGTNYFNMMLYRNMVEYYNLSDPTLIRYFLKQSGGDRNAPFWYSEMHHIGVPKCTILVTMDYDSENQVIMTVEISDYDCDLIPSTGPKYYYSSKR
jgi:hypothetical protein